MRHLDTTRRRARRRAKRLAKRLAKGLAKGLTQRPGAGAPSALHPKFFDENEGDKYKVNHMLSFWKNFQRRWASLSYDDKSLVVKRCH